MIAPRYCLAFALCAAACRPSAPPEQTNTAVPRAFTAIVARLETGISYRDYTPLLGTANTELKLYAESQQGRAHPDVVIGFRQALASYVEAGEVWGGQFEHNGDFGVQHWLGEEATAKYAERCPDATKMAGPRGPYRDAIRSCIWGEAARLANTATLAMNADPKR